MTKELPDRITSDLQSVFNRFSPKLHAPANRAVAAWVGGSMMASIDTFQKLSIKRSKYEENGENEARYSLICKHTI